MPSYFEIQSELKSRIQNGEKQALPLLRKEYLERLEKLTARNVIVYYSGWLEAKLDTIEYIIYDHDINGLMSCCHRLDQSKGLDLILHSPGGLLSAAESIIKYLKALFGNDIRAIVPQLAMSAATLIALSCKEVVMGKQSSLGPVDPQFQGFPVQSVLSEYEFAKTEIADSPESESIWTSIFQEVNPSFLRQCFEINQLAKESLRDVLSQNMFIRKSPSDVEEVVNYFWDKSISKIHDRHFSVAECIKAGIRIIELESNQQMQDTILTIHHLMMLTFQNSRALKLIDNHLPYSAHPGYVRAMQAPSAPLS